MPAEIANPHVRGRKSENKISLPVKRRGNAAEIVNPAHAAESRHLAPRIFFPPSSLTVPSCSTFFIFGVRILLDRIKYSVIGRVIDIQHGKEVSVRIIE